MPAGESFGEVTVVTPSTGDDDYPHIFKGYLRDGKYVHFMWDAVAGAMGYAISSAASDAGPYTLVALTNDNFYDLNLPVDDHFYRVAALFPDMSYGTPSQHIELKFRTPAVWTAIGGLGAINVNMVNFDSYSSVMLACKGVNEDEWFDTELTHVPFNAGWLEPMDYDCKLTLLYSDSIREESDTKRVTVYPMPDPDEFISIYVWERNADLVWNATSSNDKYSVLLQSKGGNLEVVADDLSNTQYTLTDLLCDNEYVAYVVNKTTSVLSSPVEFKLDSGFCALNPDSVEREGINKITKLNNAPFARQYFGDLSVIGDKMYLFGGSTGNVTLMGDTWVYDPSLSNGTWTKLSTTNAPSPRDIYASAVLNDKLYIFGGRGGSSDTWEFDPTTNIWTNLMIPAPAAADTVNAIDYKGKIYMFDSTGKTFVLDTVAKTWTQRASYSSAFPFHKKPTVIGNYIYFFGGAAENPPRRAGSDLWRYSPESDTWKQLNPTGTVLARHTHAITTYNNKIYVWAGDGGDHAFLNSIQVYDPSDGSDGRWKQVIPEGAFPTSRRGSSITNMNGKLYLFAGYNGATLNDFYIYEP